MSVKRPAILFLGAVILGIIIAYSIVPTFFKLLLIAVAIFLYLKLIFDGKLNLKVLLIVALFLMVGFYRFKIEESIFDKYDKNVESLGKGNKVITGKVDTIGKSTNSNYYILIDCISDGEKLGNCRCYFSDQININAKHGNYIKVIGGTKVNEAPSNEGEFNQKSFYRSEGLNFIIFAKEFEIINNKTDKIKQKIYEIKLLIKVQISKIFNVKDAGLFSAMVTGDKTSIDKEQKRLFSDNGIAHILAISGLHLSILGLALFELLRKRFSIKFSAGIVSIFILLYGIFIDAGATSLRAISMLYIRFLSLSIGRTYDSKNTLYITCFIFLMIRPYLLFNAGFQFSYVAIFALNENVTICFGKQYKDISKNVEIINDNVEKINEKKFQRVKIPAVIVLTLFLFPITIYHYFTYPLYSILLNLIVIPLMSLVLGFGLIGLLASFLYLPFGTMIVYVVHIIFFIYDKLCYFIERLPAHLLWLGKPTLYETLYYYLALFIIIYALREKKEVILQKGDIRNNIDNGISYGGIRIILSIILLVMSIGIMSIRVHPKFRMTFISTGQGDSIFIDANDTIFTIDGGSSSDTSNGQYIMTPHIKSRAINHIDYAFITHPDSDHTNGILYLIEEEDEVYVKNLVLPINAEDDEKFDKLKNAASIKNVNIIYAKDGDEYNIKNGIALKVLNPNQMAVNDNPKKKKKDQLDANEMSLILRLDYNGKSALFTGDIGKKTIDRILKSDYDVKNLDVDVLKVPHHGSKNSYDEEFYNMVSPHFAVISYGKNNTYGHPHKIVTDALEERNTKVFKTGESGQVDIYFDKEKIDYKVFIG